MNRYNSLIAGELIAACHIPIINPATKQAFALSGIPSRAMIDQAVDCAQNASRSWRVETMQTRQKLLRRIAAVIRSNSARLAELLTFEQGKPLSQASMEVDASIGLFLYHAEQHGVAEAAVSAQETADYVRTYTPLGVVAGIIPWNFPFQIAAAKIAPALLTGNAIIVKPSPTTPIATLELGRLIASEVPPGLVQILADDGSVGPVLASHPGVALTALTGSTSTGRKIMAAAADHIKRLSLELGGNDPAIVLADADLDEHVGRLFSAAFNNSGQICGAIKRLYVEESIFDEVVSRLASLVCEAVTGNGAEERTQLGPVQNAAQYDKAMALLRSAAQSGTIVAQGTVPDGGYYIPPTLVTGLSDDHPLVREEQFAPILPILSFSADPDVIARANDTAYGLTASVWGRDRTRAEGIAKQIDAGLVCINRHNENPVGQAISSSKTSGLGWFLGEEGLRIFCQPHLIIR